MFIGTVKKHGYKFLNKRLISPQTHQQRLTIKNRLLRLILDLNIRFYNRCR